MANTIIITIGNADRGDDGLGPLVAARLRGRAPAGASIRELDGETGRLVEALIGSDSAILVDAARSGAAPGTIHRFDVTTTALPAMAPGLSSHGLGLAEAIELARTLGQLPARCVVYAVEARAFDLGAPLSPDVAAAIEPLVARVLAEVA